MIRQSVFSLAILCAVIFIAPAASWALDTRPAISTLEDYFDLLASGNLESAQQLWTEPAIERSHRFGIEYTDIPLKTDATSPIVRNLPVMRDYLFPAVKQINVKDTSFVTLDYSKLVNGTQVEYTYYMYFDGNYFWLTYPQDYYTRDWPVVESRFFRIHYEPSREEYLYPMALKAADNFISAMADSLDLSDDDVALLEEKKIEYFYCDSDSTVEVLTGHRVKGTWDMASNDVISAFFPHNHEITHLLVNFKLRTQPLYAQPIMREGIAVHYGGRWGKAPSALIYLGGFLQKEGLVQVDSIITMGRFQEQAGADMAYPVAGLFASFLLDRMGRDDYFDLYRKLSGTFDEVNGMSAPAVKRIIYEAARYSSWEDLVSDLDSYIDRLNSDHEVFGPGLAGHGLTVIDTAGVTITMANRWVSVEVQANDSFPTGNILFGYDKQLEGVHSLLFDEQYRNGQAFSGYRWGIRFDGNEAGLYDYVSNQLIAKYIFGITPSDEYRDEKNHTLKMKYLVDLSGGITPKKGDFALWPN